MVFRQVQSHTAAGQGVGKRTARKGLNVSDPEEFVGSLLLAQNKGDGHGDSDHQQEPLPLRGREPLRLTPLCSSFLQRKGGSQILGPQGYNTSQGAQGTTSTMCCTHPSSQAH